MADQIEKRQVDPNNPRRPFSVQFCFLWHQEGFVLLTAICTIFENWQIIKIVFSLFAKVEVVWQFLCLIFEKKKKRGDGSVVGQKN